MSSSNCGAWTHTAWQLILGTDSHTCMTGAFGAFAEGIGSTEMIGVLLTGETWLKVPETITVVWEGELPPGVYTKDIILKQLKILAMQGRRTRQSSFLEVR